MKPKILIVDDSADMRELLVRFLKNEGFETATAKNGRAAIDYLLQNPLPALILLDSQMDTMSGNEFLDTMEQNHRALLAMTPIIVLSGVERFHHPSIVCSLRKPVDLDKLESAISSAIKDFSNTMVSSS